jgi:hypothetical protein
MVIGFVAITLPQANTVSHSASFYDLLQPEERGKILGAKSTDATSAERHYGRTLLGQCA